MDSNIKNLLKNNRKENHRALIVSYGKTPELNIPVFWYNLYKKKRNIEVLWTYKEGCDIQRKHKKSLSKVKKKVESGEIGEVANDSLENLLLKSPIKYCSFTNTQEILGNSFDVCIIQDFEATSPNVLCRSIETVNGGGLVILLLNKIFSLESLFNLKMNIHKKLKSYMCDTIYPLFNERFIISLGWCESCVVITDGFELKYDAVVDLQNRFNPLTNEHINAIEESNVEMMKLREQLEDADKPLPQLIELCQTMHQANAVLKLLDVLTESRGSQATVSLTAGRGRGKSAALGLAVAGAVCLGFNNIFVVSPSPHNLNTFFEFIFKGFDALGYKESDDYEILQSVNPAFKDAVVRLICYKEHRQFIQYIAPSDAHQLSEAELVVIDEAAAIPLPQVKTLLSHTLVFMASTINGYEGTGRSLSLKLLQHLRKQSQPTPTVATHNTKSKSKTITETSVVSSRPLHEVVLEQSIRYNPGDPVEKWLNNLLCLEATNFVPPVATCPAPSSCDLYYVNKDVLLSGHSETESFLLQVQSLLVSSHYKNSPDDLQVLSDAPAHHLYVLLPPVTQTHKQKIPALFAIIQVAIEGGISEPDAEKVLSKGKRPSGDLLAWTLANQYMDSSLASRKALRIVRIATHPDYQGMGYGSRALELLMSYCQGQFVSLEEDETEMAEKIQQVHIEGETETIGPRKKGSTLLSKLTEVPPYKFDYIGVAFGLNQQLFKFWKKHKFVPLHLSQSVSDVTGEHNCVMVCPLCDPHEDTSPFPQWLHPLSLDFSLRLSRLLASPFSSLPPQLPVMMFAALREHCSNKEVTWSELESLLNGCDIQRLSHYSKNYIDRHVIADLLPQLASIYFLNKYPDLHLPIVQECLLLSYGLQMRPIESIVDIICVPIESALGHFNRAIRKLVSALNTTQENHVYTTLPTPANKDLKFTPVEEDLMKEINEGKKEASQRLYSVFGNLSYYAVEGDDEEWNERLKNTKQKSIVSIKSKKRLLAMTEKQVKNSLQEDHDEEEEDERMMMEKKGKKGKKKKLDQKGNRPAKKQKRK